MHLSGRRIRAITTKELRHIVRDWQTLMIIIVMPVVMMFLYGYALTMDMKEAKVLIASPHSSPDITAITNAIDGSSLFKVDGIYYGAIDAAALFKTSNAKAIIIFGSDFSSAIRTSGRAGHVDVLINGSDPNQATIIRNAVEGVLTNATLKTLKLTQPKVVTVRQKIFYNPQQQSALYFVPGLMAIIILMISALLTALAITREKEQGTMEQLLVSPLCAPEIIIGKILPYIVLAAIDALLIMVVGYFAFGVRIAGSSWELAAVTLVYIFTALSFGLLFSTIAKTQQQAMLMVLPATMMPTIILSGFIFPIASMPLALQGLSYLIPATYYLHLIRGIILKGSTLALLWPWLLVLVGQGVLFTAISIKKFKVQL